MVKLLPCLFVLAALLFVTGSVDVPAPYLPQTPGDRYIQAQGVCSAPPSLLAALYSEYPALRQVPAIIQRSEKALEAWLPDMALPTFIKSSSLIDSILAKAVPRFL